MQGSWEKKMIERVHNTASRKRMASSDEGSSLNAKRGRPKQSLTLSRYPPVRDVGEDDVTTGRNAELLHKELQSQWPRKDVILSLAAQTFTSCREAVLNESADISATSLLIQFPEFKVAYVVSYLP